MRSWENRHDTAVMDEPLYAHFLAQTGRDHPGRHEILAAGPIDLARAVRQCESPQLESWQTISYQKHMAHHLLPGMDLEWISNATNVLLVRHPRRAIASYTKVRETPSLEDLGFPQLAELQRRFGPLPVVDADQFLADPEAALRTMCQSATVPFDSAMLSWPTGPRQSDGVWSRYWYSSVEASTRFGPPLIDDPSGIDLPEHLEVVAGQALSIYESLLLA
jgi:hypothetical protein